MKRLSFLFFVLSVILSASAQEYPFTQAYATISYRNPAFTGITIDPKLSLQLKTEGETSHYQRAHDNTFSLGYEQRISERAGSIGGQVIIDQTQSGLPWVQNRFSMIQYAYSATGENGSLLLGARVGTISEKFHEKVNTVMQNDVTRQHLHFGFGTALTFRPFYAGISLLNVTHPELHSKAYDFDYDMPQILTFQTAAFIHVKPKEKLLIIAPSFDHIRKTFGKLESGYTEKRSTFRLDAFTNHVTFGTGLMGEDERVSVTFTAGIVTPRLKVGYTYGKEVLSSWGGANSYVIHELNLAFFLTNPKEIATDGAAYYFRHLF